MKIKLSRLSFAVFAVTAFSCFLSLVFLQFSGENILNQKDLSSKATGALTASAVFSSSTVAPANISNLNDSQIRELSDLYAKKIASPSATATSNLNNALVKYNIPAGVQAELDYINSKAGTWTANYNPVMAASPSRKSNFAGVDINEEDLKEIRSSSSNVEIQPIIAGAVDNFGDTVLPSSFDWRNVGGKSYITAVQYQGQICPSCWAFAATAALEAKIKAYYNNPGMTPDLSEQDLISCQHGGCSTATAIQIQSIYTDYFVNTGVASETCFPYSQTSASCSKCSGWDTQVWKTDNTYKIINPTIENIKSAIINYGPVEVNMKIYSDFVDYKSGIYHHITSLQPSPNAHHAVLIIGYGIENGVSYWIIKNSWGTNWGETNPYDPVCKADPSQNCKGFARIMMGDSDINKLFAFAPGVPQYTTAYTKICTDSDADGFCYWGLGAKPSTCAASCAATEDCDDSVKSIHTGCGSPVATGTVNISSTPSSAAVYISVSGAWNIVGQTPLTLSLAAGKSYQFKVAKPNEYFDSDSQTADVTVGNTTNLSFVLSKNPKYNSGFVTSDISSYADRQMSAIDGNNIVWNNGSSGEGEGDIFLYNFSTKFTKKITSSPSALYAPKIKGNIVVWTDTRNFDSLGYYNVYMYDLSTNVESLVASSAMFPDTDGTTIVWLKIKNPSVLAHNFADQTLVPALFSYYEADIFGYNSLTGQQFQIMAAGADSYSAPSISGNNVAFGRWHSAVSNRPTDAVLYNLQTKKETILEASTTTAPFIVPLSPSVWNNTAAWISYNLGDSSKMALYTYNISTAQKVKIYTGFIRPPVIASDDKVVCNILNAHASSVDWDILMYDLSVKKLFQVTNDYTHQIYPAVSNNAIIWTDLRDDGPTIYLRDLSIPLTCTTAQCVTSCITDWSCTEWSKCSAGKQTRTCADNNKCNDNSDKPPITQNCVSVTGVSVSAQGGATLVGKGQTLQMVATVLPDNVTNTAVTWLISSGTALASIDATGIVTGKTAGDITVKAVSQDNTKIFGTKTITVTNKVLVDGIDVMSEYYNTGTTFLAKGQSVKMTAGVIPANAENQAVTWSIEDGSASDCATIDATTGVAYGVKVCSLPVVVRATAQDGSGRWDRTFVIVKPTVLVNRIEALSEYDNNSFSVQIGKSVQMHAKFYPDNVANKNVKWSQNQPSRQGVAIDSSGLLTANKLGKTTVIVTANDGSNRFGTAIVNVTSKALVNKVIVSAEGYADADQITLRIGQKLQLTANVLPAYANNKNVKWTQSQPSQSYVILDSSGLITANKAGPVTIMATAQDGTGKMGYRKITIIK